MSSTRVTWSNAGGRWSTELVGYALDWYHRRHLRMPTVRELRAGVDGLPSHATIRRMYGCASRMYEQHGYRARKRSGQPGRATTLPRDPFGRFLPKAGSPPNREPPLRPGSGAGTTGLCSRESLPGSRTGPRRR